MDIGKDLKDAIEHRLACIEKPYLNGFAGTGVSRRRKTEDIHAIARKVMDRTFDPFSFHWNFDNGEPAGFNDVYLVVFTCLFDIDDEDARRWTDKTEYAIARNEAAREMAQAFLRKFDIAKRQVIYPKSKGPHNHSLARYEDNRGW